MTEKAKKLIEKIKKETGLSIDEPNFYYVLTMLEPSRERNEVLDYIINNEKYE